VRSGPSSYYLEFSLISIHTPVKGATCSNHTPVTEEVLNVIAYLPTKSFPTIVEDKFFVKLSDRNIMRIAVLLAQKSYDEGGAVPSVVLLSITIRAELSEKDIIHLCRITTLTTTVKLRPYEMRDGRTSAIPQFSQRSALAIFAPR